MSADDPTHVCQTDTGTFEILLPMQSLKHSKEFICVVHIKANTVVADKDHGFIIAFFLASDLDVCNFSSSGEFQSVGDQIDQHNTQQGAVTINQRQSRDLPLDIPVSYILSGFMNDILDQFIQIDIRLEHFAAPHARKG